VITPDDFSRIEKLFVDRDNLAPEEAGRRLASHRVALLCGPEVAGSPSLQAAVLTATNVAARCFPGAVSLHTLSGRSTPLLVPWSRTVSLEEAAMEVAPGLSVARDLAFDDLPGFLVFGARPEAVSGLQITFDGWVAGVHPVDTGSRLAERERCVLAGVAAGALAVAETFSAFAGLNIEATRRSVGISLWRPDLPWWHEDAVGVATEYLPAEAWCMGLGHLGQAYLWCLSLLPYPDPAGVNLVLNDFDRVVKANLGTGLLSLGQHVGRLKGSVAGEWLEARGFRPRRFDRPFDATTRRHPKEPILALCGFDGKGPRHLLDDAGFGVIVECGLGGKASNFDAILLHTLPISDRPAHTIWEEGEGINRSQVATLVERNKFYRRVAETARCGHVELAGTSVAVPFVGAVAGSLVVAATLRMLHDGERYESIDLSLSCPDELKARRTPCNDRRLREPGVSFQVVLASMSSPHVSGSSLDTSPTS